MSPPPHSVLPLFDYHHDYDSCFFFLYSLQTFIHELLCYYAIFDLCLLWKYKFFSSVLIITNNFSWSTSRSFSRSPANPAAFQFFRNDSAKRMETFPHGRHSGLGGTRNLQCLKDLRAPMRLTCRLKPARSAVNAGATTRYQISWLALNRTTGAVFNHPHWPRPTDPAAINPVNPAAIYHSSASTEARVRPTTIDRLIYSIRLNRL